MLKYLKMDIIIPKYVNVKNHMRDNSQLNVLILIKRLEYGGAENYVTDLANDLAKYDNNVFIAAEIGRRIGVLDKSITVIPIEYKKIYAIYNVLKLSRIIQQNKIEIIHANQKWPIIIGVFLRKVINIPLVATLHGKLDRDIPSKFIQNSIDRLLVVCPYWYAKVKEKIPHLALRTNIIPNGIKKFEEEILNKNSELNILYSSRLGRVHGKLIKLLISEVIPELVKSYPNIKLIIIGDGDYYEEIKKLAIKKNMALDCEVIKLIGYKEDIKESLENIKIALGVGRVAMEILSVGIPLIAVNNHHFGDIVSQINIDYMLYNNFVARDQPPPNSKKIIDSIKKLLNNYDFWIEETKHIQKNINENYNLEIIVPQIIAIYKDLLNNIES